MATYIPSGRDPMETKTDHEVGGLKNTVAIARQKRRKQASAKRGTLNKGADAKTVEGGIPWRLLKIRHPEYDADYWEECRALYSGGPRLLRNPHLMRRLFPTHNAEAGAIYQERMRRAFYIPYAGEIIDFLCAGLGADPLRVEHEKTTDEEPKQLPQFWMDWLDDVSPPGGRKQSFRQLMGDQLREALLTRRSWTLVDLPSTPEEEMASRLDEDRAGLNRPYLIPIDPSTVVDWQEDENGELDWVLICDREQRRGDITDERTMVTLTFTRYDRVGWRRWRVSFHPDRPPEDDELVAPLDEGAHPFGVVPLLRMELPEGLYAMGKLASIAREHFNKRNAEAWAEYKSLYPLLYEFMGPEDGSPAMPVSARQENPARGNDEVRGQGYTNLRGHQDDAKFVGPDPIAFKEARESCNDLMREMHRVMYSMALSVDMNSAAVRRSGESKSQDKAAQAVVLVALGEILRDYAMDVLILAAKPPNVKEAEFHVSGAKKFDAVAVADAITEAVELLNGVPQKSPTFQRIFLLRLYKLILAGELTEEEVEAIREELDEQINAESLMMSDPSAPGMPEEDMEDDDEDDDEPRPSARVGGTPNRPIKFSSAGR